MEKFDIPRQYVKVKTLSKLVPSIKRSLLICIWESKNTSLCILRIILQTERSGLHYLEKSEKLSPEQEIPLSIFKEDNEIQDYVKNAIERLFRQIVFAKRLRYMTHSEAQIELDEFIRSWWEVNQVIMNTMELLSRWHNFRKIRIKKDPQTLTKDLWIQSQN